MTYRITSKHTGALMWEGEANDEADALRRFDDEVGYFPQPEGVPADWAEHFSVEPAE